MERRFREECKATIRIFKSEFLEPPFSNTGRSNVKHPTLFRYAVCREKISNRHNPLSQRRGGNRHDR